MPRSIKTAFPSRGRCPEGADRALAVWKTVEESGEVRGTRGENVCPWASNNKDFSLRSKWRYRDEDHSTSFFTAMGIYPPPSARPFFKGLLSCHTNALPRAPPIKATKWEYCFPRIKAFPSRGRCPVGADRVTMEWKTAGIRFPCHSYESCKSPAADGTRKWDDRYFTALFYCDKKTMKSPIDGEIDRAFIGERVLLSRNKMNL